MKSIITSKINNWRPATKTKSLIAKHITAVVTDTSVYGKFLISTLEGKEPLGANVMFCIGTMNDAWQQPPEKLLKKYDVISIDTDGWLLCKPKPENVVDAIVITQDIIDSASLVADINPTEYFIIGQWGESITYKDLHLIGVQRCELGDYICRNQIDQTDVWIVRKKIFENSYSFVS